MQTHAASSVKWNIRQVLQRFYTRRELSLCFCIDTHFCKLEVAGDETHHERPDAENRICFIMGNTGKLLSRASAPLVETGPG